ncbi:MAG: PAS domain-containing protein [Candidatus Gribaldobacteria bacterium]|nr:PAS domain-containing protein [Candidatus Gribaldobacteria bacterium]
MKVPKPINFDSKKRLKDLQADLDNFRFYFEEFATPLPLPFLIVNSLGVIINSNLAFEKLVGLNEEKIIGEEIEKFFSVKDNWSEYQRKVFNGIAVKGVEMRILTKTKTIPVKVYLEQRKDRESNVIGCFVGIFDITDLKELYLNLEQKVQERTKELGEKVEELEKFYKLSVGRELKMVELKKELSNLRKIINDSLVK